MQMRATYSLLEWMNEMLRCGRDGSDRSDFNSELGVQTSADSENARACYAACRVQCTVHMYLRTKRQRQQQKDMND